MIMTQAQSLSFLTQKLHRLTAAIEADTRRLKAGYDPNQPRVPAGQSTGGQWAGNANGGRTTGDAARKRPPAALPRQKPSGGTEPRKPRPVRAMTPEELARFNRAAPAGTPPEDLEIDPAFGLPRWYVDGAVDSNVISPFDFIGGGAIRETLKPLAEMTVAESASLVSRLRSRFLGQELVEEVNPKILQAEKSILEFLGGKPDRVIYKNEGDLVLIKDDLAVRFDIVKYGSSKEARPHFQLQRRIPSANPRKEDWIDLDKHWYDFLDSRDFIKE